MILTIVMAGVERVIGLSVGRGGCAECGSTTKCGPCYIPGMFRYLLICMVLFTGSAHTADEFDAVKKAVQDAAFDKFIDQGDDRPGRRTIQISLSLPTQFLNAIDERAKGLGISRAALIKQASALFLENNK